jgi:hypothetical protein
MRFSTTYISKDGRTFRIEAVFDDYKLLGVEACIPQHGEEDVWDTFSAEEQLDICTHVQADFISSKIDHEMERDR